jgi:hypothetical protein
MEWALLVGGQCVMADKVEGSREKGFYLLFSQ